MKIYSNGKELAVSGSAFDVYEEDERLIGSWFSKPLYRRIFKGVCPAADSQWHTLNAFTESVVGVMLNCYMTNSSDGSIEPLPTLANSGSSTVPTKIQFAPGIGLQMYNSGSWYVDRLTTALLYYTKNGDAVASSEISNVNEVQTAAYDIYSDYDKEVNE